MVAKHRIRPDHAATTTSIGPSSEPFSVPLNECGAAELATRAEEPVALRELLALQHDRDEAVKCCLQYRSKLQEVRLCLFTSCARSPISQCSVTM